MGAASAAPPKAEAPVEQAARASAGRRGERTVGVSAEQRSRLMARPLVRRALELTGGSIVDVVRRGEPLAEPSAVDAEQDPGAADEVEWLGAGDSE